MNSRNHNVPNTDEGAIESQIQAKGLNAPRLNPQHIDDTILHAQFYVFPNTTLTVCCLTLKNGFTVTGESASASAENFDRAVGEQIAYRNARDKIWSLEGYLLRQKLHDDGLPSRPRYRCAETGEYVTQGYAEAHPTTTFKES